MTSASDGAAEDDFAAGWLLACKAMLAAGETPPDPDAVDAPPALRDRLRRGTACLHALHTNWSVDTAPTRPVDGPPRTERFVIVGELGRGGFGVVYRAHDTVLGREVALKVPSAAALARPAGRERFAVEAEATARLGHPNIVAVYDAGFDGATPYIATEFCPGLSLAEWLERHTGPVPWRDAATLTATLAVAVHHAHDRGVLHRDLKPANVLLAAPDPGDAVRPLQSYVPKVADFGLAKLLAVDAVSVTGTGLTPGTPEYMAPEQGGGAGRDVTTAADVYALGAVLYELLTGRPPFRGDSPLATLDLARTAQPAPPRADRRDLPVDLETVCLKCLEKTPAARYPSAAALADDLARVLAGEPVLARRATVAERLFRLTRRHPVIAGLTVLLVVALVAGLGVTSYLLAETRRERDRAEQTAAQLLDAYDNAALLALNHPSFRSDAMRPFRDAALRQSADRFRALAATSGDAPRNRWFRALSHHRLADIAFALDDAAGVRLHVPLAVHEYERMPPDWQAGAPRYGACYVLMKLALVESDGAVQDRLVERIRGEAAAMIHRSPRSAAELHVNLAAFYFDLAVLTSHGSDRDKARRFLDQSRDELTQARGGGEQTELSRVRQETVTHQFRCLIDRFNGHPADAVLAGEASVAAAVTATQRWGKTPDCWLHLGGAYLEYGSALQDAGRPGEGIDVWKQGYAKLKEAIESDATECDRIELCNCRRMLAYNISLGYGRLGHFKDALEWGREAKKLGDTMLMVRPDDDQALYNLGVTCFNITEWSKETGEPADKTALLQEGLSALERSLVIRPGEHGRRAETGYVWHEYANSAAAAGNAGEAAAAIRSAVLHQTIVCLADPTAEQAKKLGVYLLRCLVLHSDPAWIDGRRARPIR